MFISRRAQAIKTSFRNIPGGGAKARWKTFGGGGVRIVAVFNFEGLKSPKEGGHKVSKEGGMPK